jgi:F-box domain
MQRTMYEFFGLSPKGTGSGKGWTQSLRQLDAMEGKKRLREEEDRFQRDMAGGSRTPTLVSSRKRILQVSVNEHDDEPELDQGDRPIKRFRGEHVIVAVSAPKAKLAAAKPQASLKALPEDVLSHCLSFLNTVEDRFALQTTCKQFCRISNTDKMLVNIQVGGDRDTGKNGIIQEHDTPETAAVVLTPFSRAGNLEAVYM